MSLIRIVAVVIGVNVAFGADLLTQVLDDDRSCSEGESSCAFNAMQFRGQKRRGKQAIDVFAGLYTIGSPGTAYPGFRFNQSKDGCFPGLRTFNTRLEENTWSELVPIHDPITFLAYVAWYEHPRMSTLSNSIVNSWMDNTNNTVRTICSETSPQHKVPESDTSLWVTGHLSNTYITGLRPMWATHPRMAQMAHFAALAYYDQQKDLATNFRKAGWTLAGRAQVSRDDIAYLAQQPKTLECALLFRGTDSAMDAVTDLAIRAEHFCGFTGKSDTHGFTVEKGDHQVHGGFVRELMRMVKSEEYKKAVYSKLPYCSKVNVAGHSLGGAMAELFAACLSRAPHEGSDGYDDYTAINWTPATPMQLSMTLMSGSPIDEAIPCEEDSGGNCKLMACDAGRGNTSCSWGNCLCAEGFCSIGGVCVKKLYVENALKPFSGLGH